MPRAVDGRKRKNRRKKILKRAKGFWGRRSTNYKTAKEAVIKAYVNAFKGRKRKKRDFRRLWITRISAICRANDISYSGFINGLKKSGINLNRKILSNLAIEDRAAFLTLIEKAKAAGGTS
ncbi:MAG: 50S ribosomal protein L20 [Spirochaetales bacterium]|nr:50S ribosomal protein L20 [Spirochaetales bacterium]